MFIRPSFNTELYICAYKSKFVITKSIVRSQNPWVPNEQLLFVSGQNSLFPSSAQCRSSVRLGPRRLFDSKLRSRFRRCCGLTAPNSCDEVNLESLSSAARDRFLGGVLTCTQIKYFTNKIKPTSLFYSYSHSHWYQPGRCQIWTPATMVKYKIIACIFSVTSKIGHCDKLKQ